MIFDKTHRMGNMKMNVFGSFEFNFSTKKMGRLKNISEKFDFSDLFVCVIVFAFTGAFGLPKGNELYVPPKDSNSRFPHPGRERIPNWLVIAMSVAIPLLVLVSLNYFQKRFPFYIRKFDLWRSIWSLVANIGLATLCVCIFKNFVGRARPDLYAAMKDNSEGTNSTFTGNPSDDAFRSWPSGHASTVFSSLCFIALFINKSIKKGNLYCTVVASLFLYIAYYVGATRIIDFRHHPDDVIAGAFCGVLFTFITWQKSGIRCFRSPSFEIDSSTDIGAITFV